MKHACKFSDDIRKIEAKMQRSIFLYLIRSTVKADQTVFLDRVGIKILKLIRNMFLYLSVIPCFFSSSVRFPHVVMQKQNKNIS